MLSLHAINISTDTLTIQDKVVHESASEVIPGKRMLMLNSLLTLQENMCET
jgi:hypothetical protein